MKFAKFALIAATALSAAAHADTFHYSFALGASGTLSGSFDGTASGDLVTGLTNINAFIDGVAFKGNGSLFGSSFLPGSGFQSGGAVASFSGYQNNFVFADSDFPIDKTYTNIAYVISATSSVSAVNLNTGQLINTPAYAGWTLTNVTAVPEPETYALLLAGLGLMGCFVQRSKGRKA